jgi:hypothetical protein
MPDELLALVDEYLPHQQFLVIPSNHQSVMLISFAEIGMDVAKPISDEEYRQELEQVLLQLGKEGLDMEKINSLRQLILASRNGNIDTNLVGYPPQMLIIVQKFLEEALAGSFKSLVDFYNSWQ